MLLRVLVIPRATEAPATPASPRATASETSPAITVWTVGELLREDSTVRADGPDGVLNHIEAHDLHGFVSGDTGIGSIIAHNNLGGNLGEPAFAITTPANKRSLGGIGSVTVGNDILTGAYVRATDKIGSLTVGGNIQSGSVVQARSIDDLDVAGNIFGDIIVVG